MTTTKHALRYNGAPYDADAQLRHDDTRITSGSGRALCACGAISEVLASGAARRAWFKAHREMEPVVVAQEEGEDLLGLLEEAEPAPEPEPEQVEWALPFAPLAPVSYWRYLGRDGSRIVVGLLYPTVTAKPDNKERQVVLSGPEPDVSAAFDTLGQLWLEAVQAAAEWATKDPAYLARPKGGVAGRMAAYHMKGEFLLGYMRQQAEARAIAGA